jgi:hypothetical protein
LSGPSPAWSQTNPAPVAEAIAITVQEQPVIDGDLSDAVWARSNLIDHFYQVEPQAYATPSERTEVRLLYDAETLYVSIYCLIASRTSSPLR